MWVSQRTGYLLNQIIHYALWQNTNKLYTTKTKMLVFLYVFTDSLSEISSSNCSFTCCLFTFSIRLLFKI